MPRCQDLAIFVSIDNDRQTMTDKTDCFTPCARAQCKKKILQKALHNIRVEDHAAQCAKKVIAMLL